MIQATLVNTGAYKSQHWVTVTFPSKLVSSFGVEASFESNGQKWRAVRGSTHEQKTTYRIQASLEAGERVVGHLVNSPADNIEEYKIHSWVLDDISDIIPSISSNATISPPQIMESSPAHVRWRYAQRTHDGFILEWWADILHNDPVVPVWGKLVWSDRSDPNPSKTYSAGSLKLACGEYIVLDFAHRRKLTKPLRGSNGNYIICNEENLVLDDGVGIPLTGRMLCFVSSQANGNYNGADFVKLEQDVNNLQAASTGEILGVCNEWGGHWLAHNKIPNIANMNVEETFKTEYEVFENELTQSVGVFSKISKLGIGMFPGQTGRQEDFGATKGTYAVSLGKPEWLLPMRYVSHYELFRSINLYDVDGNPLLASNHPQWVTWNGKTHWHTGASPDRIGKNADIGWPHNGWYGYDDQHRSQNNFCAYALLSDDPLVHDQILHQLEVDKACYRIKYPNNGIGASRAVGRQMLTWANMSTIFRRDEWLNLIQQRAYSASIVSSLDQQHQLKVLSTGNPDGRKQVYLNGQLAEWTSLWEAGLAMVGLYAAYKQMPNNQTLTSITDKLSETLLNKACFEENNKHYLVADVVWNNGQGPGALSLANGWNASGANPKTQEFIYTEGLYGVTEWTFAGILAAKKYAVSRGLPVPQNVDRLIDETTAGWSTKERAEWWAM